MPLGFIAEGLFVCENSGMNEKVERLIRCGFAPHDALRMCKAMVKDFGFKELEDFVSSVEGDVYVGRIQSKPDKQACR